MNAGCPIHDGSIVMGGVNTLKGCTSSPSVQYSFFVTKSAQVHLDCDNIRDWPTFHEEFARVFGFPDFYGKNLDAWIDCLTSLDAPEDGMTTVHCEPSTVMTLELENVKSFSERCPDQYKALIECAAFVNWRRNEVGQPSVIALSFSV